jgi:hypothetical protein
VQSFCLFTRDWNEFVGSAISVAPLKASAGTKLLERDGLFLGLESEGTAMRPLRSWKRLDTSFEVEEWEAVRVYTRIVSRG